MSDIGPGDVMEHLYGNEAYFALRERSVIKRIGRSLNKCPVCKMKGDRYVFQDNRHPDPTWGWCPNHWRKIGGSQADTVRRFAEDLTIKPPKKVDA